MAAQALGQATAVEAARRSEKLICQQLIQQGWTVMGQNFRRVAVEVDIIAQKGTTVIAVEVKARQRVGDVSRLFSPRQIRRIKGALVTFLGARQIPYQTLRVDGALVVYRPPWQVVDLRYWVNLSEDFG